MRIGVGGGGSELASWGLGVWWSMLQADALRAHTSLFIAWLMVAYGNRTISEVPLSTLGAPNIYNFNLRS